MSQTRVNKFVRVVIALLSVDCILCSTKLNHFCDDNDTYVDAVLWGGNKYMLTRNQWIAHYNEISGFVGEYHKSELYCE
jgi:hypothetical protein